jgi:hypothetical protein
MPISGCKCPTTKVLGGGKGYVWKPEITNVDIANIFRKWNNLVHRKKWHLCMTEMSFMPWPLHRDVYGQGFLNWKEEMESICDTYGW